MANVNTILKYLGIANAFASVGTKVYQWLLKSQAAQSSGGKEITAEEIAALEPVIQEALISGFQSAEVPIMIEIKLIPLE